jgi:porin
MLTSWRVPLLVFCLGLTGPVPVHAQPEPPRPVADDHPENSGDPPVSAGRLALERPPYSLFDCPSPAPFGAGWKGGSLFDGFDFPYDLGPNQSADEAVDNGTGAAGARPSEQPVGGNPAATNVEVGTGTLGEILGLDQYGIRVGGIWFFDESVNFRGGVKPGGWAGEELFTTEVALDLEKLCGWSGGRAAADVLQHNGSPAGKLTGDVMGFDGLDGGPPLRRTELYQLWFLQTLCDGRLAIRIGKLVPTFQFTNIARATSLIATPVFAMPTMLGRVVGYPDSAWGVTVQALPTEHCYGAFGFYDGRLGGSGTPTGLVGPQFNGQYFYIGEVGTTYALGGANKLEGKAGIGVWYQTQAIRQFDGPAHHGEAGFYVIARQQLWNANPGKDNRGVAAFFQFGRADPSVQLVQTYLGGGLTWVGPLRCRPQDSAGIGMFWADLTNAPGAGNLRANETTVQCYYQAILSKNWFVEPVLSYINDPARNRNLANPLALTLRLGLVF